MTDSPYSANTASSADGPKKTGGCMKKVAILIGILLVLGVIIQACNSGDDKTDKAAEATDEETTTEETTEPAVTPESHDEAEQWIRDHVDEGIFPGEGGTDLTSRAKHAIEEIDLTDDASVVELHMGINPNHPEKHELMKEAAHWVGVWIATSGDTPQVLLDNLDIIRPIDPDGHGGVEQHMSFIPIWEQMTAGN